MKQLKAPSLLTQSELHCDPLAIGSATAGDAGIATAHNQSSPEAAVPEFAERALQPFDLLLQAIDFGGRLERGQLGAQAANFGGSLARASNAELYI